jgi:hypothetical protein
MICKCPRAESLPDIPRFECPETFGQIQKVAFQRITSTDGTKNKFTTLAAITTLASWTPFMVAADSTKIVMSPYIQNPEAAGGGPRMFGGGNETLGGVEEVVGTEPTPFTGIFRKVPQTAIKALKQLGCEDIGVYLIDENGAIGAIKGDTEGDFFPIPVRAFFVGDKTLGGYDAPDSNVVQWNFLPNWSNDLTMVYPTDFNPLTDLKGAE